MPIVACPSCGAKNRVEARGPGVRPVCGRCGTGLPADDGHPLELTDATFATALESAGDRPVLVDCWAPWCGPCRMLTPTIERLAQQAAGRFVIAKLNTDENPRVAGRFQITSIPTLLIFKNSVLVEQLMGAQALHVIQDRLEAHA
ncbi:MAG: thioredoxin [Armatimonadetes bacterium]|nr:thioredoxin [Armatimonadota bacterium]